MCRFIAYIGNPLILDEVLFKPANSIIKQSVHAKEMDEPLNGDGFGMGWYAQDIDSDPGVFRSIQPAWNDLNLRHLAAKIRSNCFFTHVRKATNGIVSLANCHPFNHDQFMFMHNGDIGDIDKIRRYMRRELPDDIYNWVQGQTDSELLFASFLKNYQKQDAHFNPERVAEIFIQTLDELDQLKKQQGATKPSRVNAVITNGKAMVAFRYISSSEADSPTLYFAAGDHYEYSDGRCHIKPSDRRENGAAIVASERMSSYNADWQEVPINHYLMIYEDLSTVVKAI